MSTAVLQRPMTPFQIAPADTSAHATGGVSSGQFKTATIMQNVNAIAGTAASLATRLQGSPDGTSWFDVPSGGLTAATATGFQRVTALDISGFQQVRFSYTLSGTTPTATASLYVQLAPI